MLSAPGLALATALLALLAWINLAGVGWLARWIDGLTAWKLAVPLVISVTLMLASGHWGNLAASRLPPGETLQGMVTAISSGGILFSLLGFRTAMDLAGETRRPQRTVPLAMALGLAISLGIYLILQLAFLVSIPPTSWLAAGRDLSSPPTADPWWPWPWAWAWAGWRGCCC